MTVTVGYRRGKFIKADFRRSFNDHHCLGTTSQVTQKGRRHGMVRTGDQRHGIQSYGDLFKFYGV